MNILEITLDDLDISKKTKYCLNLLGIEKLSDITSKNDSFFKKNIKEIEILKEIFSLKRKFGF